MMISSLRGGLTALALTAAGAAYSAAQKADLPVIQKAAPSQTTAGIANAPEIQTAQEIQRAPGIEKIAAYAGSWSIHIEHLATPFSKASDEHTELRNDCWRSGGFFACNQYVDGVSKALIVFTFDATSGHYTTYPIPTDGSAAGSGRLEIQRNVWTFPWESKDGEKTTYFRVVNVFTAPDTIEYRQEFSTDKVNWTLMGHGLEKKAAQR
jgi:hypothetical protein